MRRSIIVSAAFAGCLALVLVPLSGCGSSGKNGFGRGGSSGAPSGGASGAGGSAGFSLTDGGGGSGGFGGTAGSSSCPSKTTTSISGTVYDPALLNPLYGINVFVPAGPLAALPRGVPTGKDACSCGALYPTGAIVNTSTAIDGTFTLENVPVGASVPLVLQVGKWRRLVHLNVKACQDNPQPDKSLALPGTVPSGDTNDNIPDIAVSTGQADTLECLMTRIGLPASEYVAGAVGSGHVHIFSGGNPLSMGLTGQPESPAMPGAPPSHTSLWATQAQLMPYDIVLLSCEAGETYAANPPALEAYLNAGGRAFASHLHYSWFSGPLYSGQKYSAPSDWGSSLGKWAVSIGTSSGPIGGIIDTTLNGSTKPFAKGVALSEWLKLLDALGQGGVPASELSIYDPRYNVVVGPSDTASQPWITSDSSGKAGETMYFSFDTPVGASRVCGRAVFSDLHVAGDPSTHDSPPPPGGCKSGPLSPQEKALEFMLFDLSACVIPDTQPPPDAGAPLPPPPK